MQILTEGSDPRISPSSGGRDRDPCLKQCYLGLHERRWQLASYSVQRLLVLCMSVTNTDRQTNRRTDRATSAPNNNNNKKKKKKKKENKSNKKKKCWNCTTVMGTWSSVAVRRQLRLTLFK